MQMTISNEKSEWNKTLNIIRRKGYIAMICETSQCHDIRCWHGPCEMENKVICGVHYTLAMNLNKYSKWAEIGAKIDMTRIVILPLPHSPNVDKLKDSTVLMSAYHGGRGAVARQSTVTPTYVVYGWRNRVLGNHELKLVYPSESSLGKVIGVCMLDRIMEELFGMMNWHISTELKLNNTFLYHPRFVFIH